MKLSHQPSRIVGLRVGEVAINLLSPGASSVVAKFVLLRDPSQGDTVNSGQFTKVHWSPEAIQAFERFIDALEDDAVRDLFGNAGDVETVLETQNSGLKFPLVPVLGGSK